MTPTWWLFNIVARDQGGNGVFQDKTMACRDCGDLFLFTAGEQGYFLERNLLNEPQRCYVCRERRRRERIDTPRMATTIVCAECGAPGTVPFVPRQNRPVYCAGCFERVRRGAVA
jgi:CxxC-x17-CxxC domain-containing protein